MSSDWESIVSIARVVDAACAKGEEPDTEAIGRLPRAVLNFERRLASPLVKTKSAATPESTGNGPDTPE